MKHHVYALLLLVNFSLCNENQPEIVFKSIAGDFGDFDDDCQYGYDFFIEDEIVRYICKYGLEERDIHGNTVLHAAALMNNGKKIIEILLRKGINKDIRNNAGFTPLHLAVEHERDENIEVLVRNGANVNTQTADGRTLLMSALGDDMENLLEYLILFGADLNVTDKRGFTILHYVVMCNKSIDHINFVLEHGANVNARSHSGVTPLHLAVYSNNPLMVELLLKYGARASSIDARGNKPIRYMCRGYNDKLVALLSQHDKSQALHKKEFSIDSQVNFEKVLLKQIYGAAFYFVFPEMKDEFPIA